MTTKKTLTDVETKVHRAIKDLDASGVDATVQSVAERLGMPESDVDDIMVALVGKDVIEVCYGEVWHIEGLGDGLVSEEA